MRRQDFLAALRFEVDFFAVDFLAGLFFAVDFFAVDFLAGLVLAVDFLAGLFLAVDFFAGLFFAVVFLAVLEELDFLAGVDLTADRAGALAAETVALGSFLAPDTTAFRSAPALNLGIEVFLALIRSPVRGLRTQRDWRTRFSNEPKPVIATFSPLATSRVMVSSTDSRACEAALRLPSKRAARVSTN